MIEKEHRSRHWLSTARNTTLALGLLVVMVFASSLFSDLFAGRRFLGFPLSFYLAAQGAFLLMIVLFFWATGRQDEIDRRHGAAEEL